jgi:hypothetical protein
VGQHLWFCFAMRSLIGHVSVELTCPPGMCRWEDFSLYSSDIIVWLARLQSRCYSLELPALTACSLLMSPQRPICEQQLMAMHASLSVLLALRKISTGLVPEHHCFCISTLSASCIMRQWNMKRELPSL